MQFAQAGRPIHSYRTRGSRARARWAREDGSTGAKQDDARAVEQGKPFAGRWRGADVVCIASGPSLTADDCSAVKDWRSQGSATGPARKVIAVNNSHELAPFADVVYAMDRKWWNEYGERIAPGPELWTTNVEAARLWGLNHIRGEVGGGMSKRPNSIRLGGNSGFQALQLALHFGAARVILLGYDMQTSDGKTHWHGDHANLGNPVGSKMHRWREAFEQMPHAERARIVNASRVSALKCFKRADLRAILTASSI